MSPNKETWIITDYKTRHAQCLAVAEKLCAEPRIISEAELRGYMLRSFIQRERGSHTLPGIVISASADAEFIAINIKRELPQTLSVKLGNVRSRPHFTSFDLVVLDEEAAFARLSPEEQERTLIAPDEPHMVNDTIAAEIEIRLMVLASRPASTPPAMKARGAPDMGQLAAAKPQGFIAGITGWLSSPES